MKWHFIKNDLENLKCSVREFYGALPLAELLTNTMLIGEVEHFESRIQGLMNEIYQCR